MVSGAGAQAAGDFGGVKTGSATSFTRLKFTLNATLIALIRSHHRVVGTGNLGLVESVNGWQELAGRGTSTLHASTPR
jgi:hypothetical protein